MKTIETLIPDIYNLLENKVDEVNPEALELTAEMEHLLVDAPHHALLDARLLCAIYEAAQA